MTRHPAPAGCFAYGNKISVETPGSAHKKTPVRGLLCSFKAAQLSAITAEADLAAAASAC